MALYRKQGQEWSRVLSARSFPHIFFFCKYIFCDAPKSASLEARRHGNVRQSRRSALGVLLTRPSRERTLFPRGSSADAALLAARSCATLVALVAQRTRRASFGVYSASNSLHIALLPPLIYRSTNA